MGGFWPAAGLAQPLPSPRLGSARDRRQRRLLPDWSPPRAIPVLRYLLVLPDPVLLLLHPPQLHLVGRVATRHHVARWPVRTAHLTPGARGLVDEGALGAGPARLQGVR